MASTLSGNYCRIAITQGDYNGIGPEVVLKSLSHFKNSKDYTFLLFAHPAVVTHYMNKTGINLDFKKINEPGDIEDGRLHLVETPFSATPVIKPGKIQTGAGLAAWESLKLSTDWCLGKKADALVTAPISKESIKKAGFHYPGHTEYLAARTNSDHFIMMMVHGSLRVSLITIHVPVRDIAGRITHESITGHLNHLVQSLQKDYGIEQPSIAVLGLNPHAGDGGMIGSEEQDIIIPAMQQFGSETAEVDGPFAADGFFANNLYQSYDVVVAMFHDQGLIPFKVLSANHGVNVTLGLPIIRTSPDHGTAFNIAGSNRADANSFINAIIQARDIYREHSLVTGL